MILNGNSRSHAKDLALHLMKDENEIVEIHQMRGFISHDLLGDFTEIYAISRATHCDQFLYSLSLNPPPHEEVSVDDFMEAIESAEERLNLRGQPRAVVFHTKHGRKHAHVVWSRIDIQTMKARQISFDREKLTRLSRELFRKHGWGMPRGLQKRGDRDPHNYSYAEYQQAQRIGKNAADIKRDIRAAWTHSDCRQSLEQALSEKGYTLARGDKRGFVVIDLQGEIYSLPRYAGVKTKDVRACLGDPAALPSVDDIQNRRAEQHKNQSLTLEEALERVARYHAAFTVKMADRLLKPLIINEEERQKLIKSIVESDAVVKVGTIKKQDVFATPEMIALEKQIVTDAHAMTENRLIHKGDPRAIDQAIHNLNQKILVNTKGQGHLRTEQINILRHMTDNQQLSLVIGVAGSGKTTIMEGAKEALEAQGYRVRGAAPSGIAASKLKETGLNASTIHSLLYRLQNAQQMMDENQGCPLTPKQRDFIRHNTLTLKDTLIIDEAGMVPARQMAVIMEHVKQAGAKLILVGDPQQLQSIEAGCAFRTMLERNPHTHLTTVLRQKDDWQKQATQDFAHGNIEKGLYNYHKNRCIHFTKTRDKAKDQLVTDFMQDFDNNLDINAMVLAYTRKDVNDLNLLIKAEMIKRGVVAQEHHQIEIATPEQDEQESKQKQSFAIGDRILFGRNDTNLGVMNGSFGRIDSIQGDLFRVTLDDGKPVLFSTQDYNHLQLGYATTIHKSQGVTIDQAYVLTTPHFDQNTTYVAMSRHKKNAQIYAAQADFKNMSRLTRSLAQKGDKASTLDFIKTIQQHTHSLLQSLSRKTQQAWRYVMGRDMGGEERRYGKGFDSAQIPECCIDEGLHYDNIREGETSSAYLDKKEHYYNAHNHNPLRAERDRILGLTNAQPRQHLQPKEEKHSNLIQHRDEILKRAAQKEHCPNHAPIRGR